MQLNKWRRNHTQQFLRSLDEGLHLKLVIQQLLFAVVALQNKWSRQTKQIVSKHKKAAAIARLYHMNVKNQNRNIETTKWKDVLTSASAD